MYLDAAPSVIKTSHYVKNDGVNFNYAHSSNNSQNFINKQNFDIFRITDIFFVIVISLVVMIFISYFEINKEIASSIALKYSNGFF